MGKITVFGGSFDPIHKGHIQIAKAVLSEISPEKLIFVPAYMPPHKARQYACIDDRIAMLKLAVEGLERTEISFYEAEKQDIVYSYQTLDYFQKLYLQDEIMMIIGSDSLLDLPNWKNIDYLAGKYKFIVAKRPEVKINGHTKYFDRCIFLKDEIADISSTEIRGFIRSKSKEAIDLLDKNVYEYIKEKGLYK